MALEFGVAFGILAFHAENTQRENVITALKVHDKRCLGVISNVVWSGQGGGVIIVLR